MPWFRAKPVSHRRQCEVRAELIVGGKYSHPIDVEQEPDDLPGIAFQWSQAPVKKQRAGYAFMAIAAVEEAIAGRFEPGAAGRCRAAMNGRRGLPARLWVNIRPWSIQLPIAAQITDMGKDRASLDPLPARASRCHRPAVGRRCLGITAAAAVLQWRLRLWGALCRHLPALRAV